jgi:hypothetical protein
MSSAGPALWTRGREARFTVATPGFRRLAFVKERTFRMKGREAAHGIAPE